MSKIEKITASEISDSRGNPTIRVAVYSGEHVGIFDVPSGASTGRHEAHELRDSDGKGVKNAIDKVNNVISIALIGESPNNQKKIDDILLNLDDTKNKKNLGGNAMIGVSIACAKLSANLTGTMTYQYLRTLADIKPSREIPYLYMNLINGGKHAFNKLAFQEYHIVPDVSSVSEGVEMGIKIQNSLKELIEKDLGKNSLKLGDEGGFAPEIGDIALPLKYFKEAVEINHLTGRVRFALDVASTSFYKDGSYRVGGKEINRKELLDIYSQLITEFDLLSIEDPFEEEDFFGFKDLKNTEKGLYVVGDDLTVTNINLLEKARDMDSVNALIIKPNQIGTLTETLNTMKFARENDIECIVSHRSGETMDDFIADLAFAFGCFGIKAGSPIKPERMVKYKRLETISNFSKNKFINN